MAETIFSELPNSDYICRVASSDKVQDDESPSDNGSGDRSQIDTGHFILPHEKRALLRADEELRVSRRAVNRTASGDTSFFDPNETKILRLKAVAPYLGAQAVAYPLIGEPRATLGSRVVITEDDDTFAVDIVGYREFYPDDQDGPVKLSENSRLARLIIGKTASKEELVSSDIDLTVRIESVDQFALSNEYPSDVYMNIAIKD